MSHINEKCISGPDISETLHFWEFIFPDLYQKTNLFQKTNLYQKANLFEFIQTGKNIFPA